MNTTDDRSESCGDEGICSLREAILKVNELGASGGPHTIQFDIPESGPQIIEPESPLPVIFFPVILDGYTQQGASANTLPAGNDAVLQIILSGAQAGDPAHGLELRGGDSTVRGLVVNNFSEAGIVLHGGVGNTIEGNFIGTDVSGENALGNGYDGIGVRGSANNIIGGTDPAERNVISGNKGNGIAVLNSAAVGNEIQNNYIGTNASGTAAIGNAANGVRFTAEIGETGYASHNIVGGTEPEMMNLVSGNGGGIHIHRGEENVIQGNLIGTDITGTAALPNGDRKDPGEPIGAGVGMLIDEASNNQVGGTELGAGNVIAGNARAGVMVVTDSQDATNNTVEGNLIGLAENGLDPLGNSEGGVMLIALGSDGVLSNNAIGGSQDGAGNVISGNGGAGVEFRGENVSSNFIHGNLIGLSHDDETPAGNADHGVLIIESSDNFVGGMDTNEGNVIAFNGDNLDRKGHGVVIESGTGNLIRYNSIYGNAGRGIDLGNDTFTINDFHDQDEGANKLQNYPYVRQVEFGTDQRVIRWALHGTPDTEFVLDFYANEEPDPSGFGQGKQHIFTYTGATDQNGELWVTTTLLATDEFVAATATDPDNNTSEFSMVDTSGDAIADAWSMSGIDVDEDGSSDLDLKAMGADPDRKNIFVEIDAMQGFAPSQEARDLLVHGRDGLVEPEGFANVPRELANNPDGSAGINLHLIMGGDLNIPVEPWPERDNGWPVAFDGLKHGTAENGHRDGTFGTPEERSDSNWENIRRAKLLVFHYAVFAHSLGDDSTGGVARRPGNDLIVALGRWSGNEEDHNYRGDPLIQAGIFMHELGHNLGIPHGGDQIGDEFNFKPNYRSVVNYTWTAPHPEYRDGWRLDFSRDKLNDIDERAIDQEIGFGGDPDVLLPVGPVLDDGGESQSPILVPEGGGINLDGDPDSLGEVARDVNFLDGEEAHPDQELTGSEDWSNLQYFRHHYPAVADDIHSSISGGYTLDLHERLSAIGDGPGEVHFSLTNHEHTDGPGTLSVRVARRAGMSGDISVEVSTSDGTAVAGVDYEPVAETLTIGNAVHATSFDIDILRGVEPGEERTFHLTLSDPAGGATLSDRSTEAVVRIVGDDDAIMVTTPHDSGPGSLRRAINDANAEEGHNTIAFNIPGDGVQTITLSSQLPDISQPLTIDGYTQPGTSPNTLTHGNDAVLLIELDGSNLDESELVGLRITASNSTVRGLVINGFDSFNARGGISLEEAHSNVIEGNFIGTDPSGTEAVGNRYGLYFLGSEGNRVGGTVPQARNLISGNSVDGIHFSVTGAPHGGERNVVQGNYVGTDRDGLSALGNEGDGIRAFGDNDQIGGAEPGAGNVISGNARHGIRMSGGSGLVIQGNLIGTDRDGQNAIGNGNPGVVAQDAIIGGTAPEAGNVISGNSGAGILLANGDSATIQGNYIGTDIDGESALPNESHGIEIRTPDNQLGGTEEGAGNLISANGEDGIHILASTFPSDASGNVVEGNLIGTQSDGFSPLPNVGNGVAIFYAEHNTIGGTEPGAGNTIAYNGDPGEILFGTRRGAGIVAHNIGNQPILGNAVLGNAIFGNSLLGIDLVGDDFEDDYGVTHNVPDDGNTAVGVNDLQNFPVLTSVDALDDGSGTSITGTLQSRPDETFRIELFVSSKPDQSGFGQGEQFLGSAEVVTDSAGTTGFEVTVSYVVDTDEFVTSTATAETNSTSEFSKAIKAGQVMLQMDPPEGGGTVEPEPGIHHFDEGTDVELVAIPDFGWEFDHWVIDGAQQFDSESTTVTMDADRTARAVFSQPTYTLTIEEPLGNGTVEPEPGTYDHPENSTVALTAVPGEGTTFSHWILNGNPVGFDTEQIAIQMRSDQTIRPVFGERNVELIIEEPEGSGTVKPDPGTYEHFAGVAIELSATPGDNWSFSHWIIDGEEAADTETTTLAMDVDRTVKAVFIESIDTTFSLTIADPEGEGTVEPQPGEHEYPSGTNVEVTATPADGWTFSHWVIDGEEVPDTASTTVTMDADRTVQAVFLSVETCVDLIAGQQIDSGQVCVSNNAEELTVTYSTSDEWVLVETHLAVSADEPGSGEWTDRDNRWQNRAGNPVPGRFPYHGDHSANGDDTYTFSISLSAIGRSVEVGDDVYIAAHTVVENTDRESAWGDGEVFIQRGSWGTYFTHAIRSGGENTSN